MVYQISVVRQAPAAAGWGGIRPAPAGWLTVGRGGALAGPRRAERTAGAGHATPASAPRMRLRELSRWRRRAECRALQFAQGGAGQRRKHVDALGALIAGERGMGVCDQGGLVEGISRADGDPRGDLFAPALVGDPRDGRLGDRGVILQDRFDLAGI